MWAPHGSGLHHECKHAAMRREWNGLHTCSVEHDMDAEEATRRARWPVLLPHLRRWTCSPQASATQSEKACTSSMCCPCMVLRKGPCVRAPSTPPGWCSAARQTLHAAGNPPACSPAPAQTPSQLLQAALLDLHGILFASPACKTIGKSLLKLPTWSLVHVLTT